MLGLIAEGRSNHGIAEALVVTPGAVEKHISRIFDKLGLQATTRTTAACSPCWPTCAASS